MVFVGSFLIDRLSLFAFRATAAPNADPEIADQQRSSLATDGEAQVSVWTELVLVFLHLASDLDDATFTLLLPLLFPGSQKYRIVYLAQGASIYEVHKKLFDLLPPFLHSVLIYVMKFTQPPLLRLLFHDSPLGAGIIYESPITSNLPKKTILLRGNISFCACRNATEC